MKKRDTADVRILVLDDKIKSASGVISKCLQTYVGEQVRLPSLGTLEGKESERIPLIGFVESEVSISFTCNKPSERDAKDIVRKIEAGMYTGVFDLVLLDDQWPPYDFGGQDLLLETIYKHLPGHVEELPLIALFTQHWDDDRLQRFFRLVHEKRLNWNRLIPCDKGDKLQLLHILSRTLTTKSIALERTEEKRKTVVLTRRAKVHGISLDTPLLKLSKYGDIIGESPQIQEVFGLIQKAGPDNCAVLIRGETGTGKELVAKAIHNASKRRDKAYVPVNITAQPDTLIDTFLFGTEAGPGMGPARQDKHGVADAADGGTLFLDEIGDLKLGLQAKLLRFVDLGEFYRSAGNKKVVVDVRFVSATNRNIEAMIQNGEFREDLFYRLNDLPIHLPPLRERQEDIPLLIRYFINQSMVKNGKTSIKHISDDAMARLINNRWPDNVRGLRNCIKRAVLLCESDTIGVNDLHLEQISPAGVSGADRWEFQDFVSRGLVVRKNDKEQIQYWLLYIMTHPSGNEVTDLDIIRLWPEVSSGDKEVAQKAKSAVSSAFSRLRKMLQENSNCGWMLPKGSRRLEPSCPPAPSRRNRP